MQVREDYKNEKQWLEGRLNHIGASESSAVVGMNKYKTNVQLYREKARIDAAPKLNSSAIELGKRAEPALRQLFSAYHPNYTVDYHQYTLIYQEEYPFIASTLDGELTDDKGRKGILEIKTASVTRKAQMEEWNRRIPDAYMVQIIHQLISTGYEFVDLYGCLTGLDGDHQIRTYHFERAEHEEDIKWLIEKEKEFWNCVQTRTQPSLIIT